MVGREDEQRGSKRREGERREAGCAESRLPRRAGRMQIAAIAAAAEGGSGSPDSPTAAAGHIQSRGAGGRHTTKALGSSLRRQYHSPSQAGEPASTLHPQAREPGTHITNTKKHSLGETVGHI